MNVLFVFSEIVFLDFVSFHGFPCFFLFFSRMKGSESFYSSVPSIPNPFPELCSPSKTLVHISSLPPQPSDKHVSLNPEQLLLDVTMFDKLTRSSISFSVLVAVRFVNLSDFLKQRNCIKNENKMEKRIVFFFFCFLFETIYSE